jgi:heat shock protein HslJ/uncharacterized lipoprotein YbaY/uncharacterized membrane protein
MKALWRVALTMAILALAACVAPASTTTVISGNLTYRGPIRLPVNAVVEVALVDLAADAPQPTMAQQSMPAGDGRTALPFELRIETSRLNPARRYAVRASVRDAAGTQWWRSETLYPVDPAQPVQDLGTLVLVPGVQPPVTAPPSAPRGTPAGAYVARGNEPGWALTITGKRLALEYDYGKSKLDAAVPAQQKIADGYRYAARAGNHALRIDVLNRLCRDDMSGMSYPDSVTVVVDGKTLRGCGGDPAFLLQRGRWQVVSIDGRDTPTRARPTLVFEKLGRFNGRACNSFSGSYQLSGEGLHFGAIVATKRACASPVGEQENALLAVLRGAVRHELGEDGSLTIETNDGHKLVARKG